MKAFRILFLTFILSNSALAQTQKVVLTFNDGTTLDGFGMIHKINKIKFRISLDEDPDIWTDLMVKNIIFYGFEISIKYEFISLKPNEPSKLLEVLAEGNTNLYADVIDLTFFSNGSWNNGTFTGATFDQIRSTKIYVRRDEEFPVPLTGNFKRKAKKYFSDCSGLIKKLDSGEFRKLNSNEMVDYYNDFCSE